MKPLSGFPARGAIATWGACEGRHPAWCPLGFDSRCACLWCP